MQSFRSRAFLFLLKYRHLLKWQLKRRTRVDTNTSLQQLRNEVEKGAEFFGKLPEGYTLQQIDIDGLNAELITPPAAGEKKIILYFHGGGLVVGSAKSHRGIVAKFVKGSGISALVFDYALAPENPFPAGLNDSVKAYSYLLANGYKPESIVFMGDSGGGNLCLSTLLATKERNLPMPAAAVVLSPWTDLTNSGESLLSNDKRDPLCWKEAQNTFSKYYCGDKNPAHHLISPLFGNLTGLPPLLIFAGEYETMRDDSTRFAEKAKNEGVDVTINIGKGLFHCYPACAPLFPEAKDAMLKICDFIISHIK